MASERVAVVGGGIAGLVAARELAESGIAVAVYEREPGFGGRIRAERIDCGDAEIVVDLGAEAYATRGGAVATLIGELGLGDRVVSPAPLGSWLVRAGGETPAATPLPPAGSFGIPASPLGAEARRALGLSGALRAAAEPLLPRSVGRDAGSLAELVRARLGARTLERLVRPVVLGVQGVDPEQLDPAALPGLAAARSRNRSLLAAAAELRASASASGGAVASLRGGMHTLVARLVEQLTANPNAELRQSTEITEVRAVHGGWELLGADGGVLDRVDGVVLASPDAAAPGPGGLGPGSAAGALASPAGSRSTEIVVLVVDDARLDAAPRGTGALVAASPGERAGAGEPGAALLAKALTHASVKWPELGREAGRGRHVLRLSYDGAVVAGLDADTVLEQALADAGAILGVPLQASSVRGTARARHSVGPGPGQRTAGQTADAGRSEYRALVLVGDAVAGTGLASVVPQAREAAARLRVELAGHPTDTPSEGAHS